MNPSPGVALVTGSGKQRIGWHVAEALAGRGYRLAIHYRRSAKEAAETVDHLRSRGVEAEAFGADLTGEAVVKSLVEKVLARFGQIDVLVNAAGMAQTGVEPVSASFGELSPERDRKSVV